MQDHPGKVFLKEVDSSFALRQRVYSMQEGRSRMWRNLKVSVWFLWLVTFFTFCVSDYGSGEESSIPGGTMYRACNDASLVFCSARGLEKTIGDEGQDYF